MNKSSSDLSKAVTPVRVTGGITGGTALRAEGSSLLERVGLASQQAINKDETFQQLLSQQLDFRPMPAEPTPDCLTDIETLNFSQDGKLEASRLAHIERCRWCQSMLVGV